MLIGKLSAFEQVFSQGIAACRCRGQKKAGRNLRSRAALRARALWERAANGIRGKVDWQPPSLFSCGGRDGEDAVPVCANRRITHSGAATAAPAEMSFFGVYLSNQHNIGVDQRRGEVPSFVVSIGGDSKGGKKSESLPVCHDAICGQA